MCAIGNHDCEQICVPTSTGYNCECHPGFILNEDQKTCSSKSFITVADCTVVLGMNCSIRIPFVNTFLGLKSVFTPKLCKVIILLYTSSATRQDFYFQTIV